MRLISLMPCIFLILFTSAYAEEIVKCIDADGNTILTSDPQDTMKCFTQKSERQPPNPNREFKVNLMDLCNELAKKYDEIDDRKNDIEKQMTQLKNQQENLMKHCCSGSGDYESIQAKNNKDKMESLKEQYSSLDERQNEICREISSYKCSEIYNDMARIHSVNRKYRK